MQLTIARLQGCHPTQTAAILPAAANQLPKKQPLQSLLRHQIRNPLNRQRPKNTSLPPERVNPEKEASSKG